MRTGPSRGTSAVQSALQAQTQPERVHRNKAAGLHRAVILHEPEILRHHVKAGTEERSYNQNHQKVGTQIRLARDHPQMKHRRLVFRAIVPPEKRGKENGGSNQRRSNPVGLQPQILFAAAGGNLQAAERPNQKQRAVQIEAAHFLANKQIAGRDNFPNQKRADRQKRKIDQKRIIPVERVGDPAHHDGIRHLKNCKHQVKPRDRHHPGFPGKQQPRENHHAYQKRAAAESHDQSRSEQPRQAARAEHAAHRAGGVDADA